MGTENVDERTENASVSSDTVIFDTSDFNTNTDLVSTADSEHSDYTENTQTLSQYVKGPDTQDNSPEMYPDTLSQSSEPLTRSACAVSKYMNLLVSLLQTLWIQPMYHQHVKFHHQYQ